MGTLPMQDEAVTRLAEALGLDPRDIPPPASGRRHQEGTGIPAILAQTFILNPLGGAIVEHWPDQAAGRRLMERHYGKAKRGWDAKIGEVSERFLTGEPIEFLSPLDNVCLPVEAELFGSRVRWLQWVVLRHAPLRFLILEANTPVAIWYPERNTLLALRDRTATLTLSLRQLLETLFGQPAAFLAWLDMAGRPTARRCFILGEARPSHFMAQTLGFLERNLDRLVLPFLREGHVLAILRDRSFLDPLRVFPALRDFAVLSVTIEQAPRLLRDLGLNCRLNDRRITNTTYGWVARLRREAEPDASRPVFGVLMSIDAERMRFDNQVVAFAACLERLAREAADEGASLTVYWDGWTIPSDHVPGQRDRTVCDRIASIAANIRAACAAPFEEVALYGLAIEDKIRLAKDCRLALATYGTATILPTCALAVPTITYHVAAVCNPAMLRSARYLDPDHAVALPPEAVTPVLPVEEQAHRQRFAVDIPVLLSVLDQVLAGPSEASRAAAEERGEDT